MKSLTIFGVVVLITLVVVVRGHEFDDLQYNQILAADLSPLHSDSYAHPRSRRDADDDKKCHGKGFNSRLCCAEVVLEKMHSEERDIKKACFKEVIGKDRHGRPPMRQFYLEPFDCEIAKRQREEMICVLQCEGEKKKLVDSKGALDEAAVTEYVKKLVSSASYLDAEKIAKTCAKEAKTINVTHSSSKEADCNPAAAAVDSCIFRETQLNCPADQIKDQKVCSALQDRLKGGEGIPPPGPPPGESSEN